MEPSNRILNKSTLHFAIMKHFLDHGHAPSVNALAKRFGNLSRETVAKQLQDLQDYHGVVLHPTTSEIWVAHPFSNAPTNFWVECSLDGRKWWGNCAWCSLGVAALLKNDGDVKITTTIGGESKQVVIEIQNGEVTTGGDLYVHFPVPMKSVWDNVIYSCSVKLVFESEAQVQDWCQRHDIQKGDIVPVRKFWEFAKSWYGEHLKEDWVKWTAEEAQIMFKKFGLTGDIWTISGTGTRF